MDSLDGWVAIKTDAFVESDEVKLGFIVQWSVIESRFAVTCHNRTLQRRTRRNHDHHHDHQDDNHQDHQEDDHHQKEMSWAGLFSLDDLRNIHRQLTGVAEVLAPFFPDLSDFEDRGSVWDLLFPRRRSTLVVDDDDGDDDDEEGGGGGRRDLDTPCRHVEKYLGTAVDVCGRKIVLDSLFSQEDVEEYFENLQEFKKKTMQAEVSRAKDLLRQVEHSAPYSHPCVSLINIAV